MSRVRSTSRGRLKIEGADYPEPEAEEEVADFDEEEESTPRKPGFFVRFDRIYQSHSGPMYGPFTQAIVEGEQLIGVKFNGEGKKIARFEKGKWFLQEVKEPGYLSFAIVFA